MDINKILNSDYLDLLFEGRNKKYGSYELRKKYNRRIIIGASIAFFIFIGFFLLTLVRPNKTVVAEIPVITDVKITNPPPIDPNKPPPPPPPSTPPPPVKPTVKFTPPVIKKDDEVKPEDKPEPPKPDENKVVGPKDIAGTDAPGAIDPNLNMNPGNGKGPVEPAGPAQEKIFKFVDQQALPPGGLDAFHKYMSEHTSYPYGARQASLQGKVYYEFVVDANGNISNVTIKKDIGGGCGDEVKRVLEQYKKKWTPAKNNGHPVASYFRGSFDFTLN